MPPLSERLLREADFNSSIDARLALIKGAVNGVAPLGGDSKVPAANLPAIAATETSLGSVELATAAEILAGTAGALAVTAERLKPEAWQAPVLQNAWVNFGAGLQVAGYRKTPLGEVQLRGILMSGTMTDNTVLFNLPVGYRPAAARLLPGLQGGNVACRIHIYPSGDVTIFGVTNNAFLS